MRTYKLYATVSAAANNIVNLVVAKPGRIRSVRWAVSVDSTSDNAYAFIEVSTAPNLMAQTNDSTTGFDSLSFWNNVGAAGVALACINRGVVMDYPVAAGERLYLNANASGTLSAYTTVYIDVDESR